MNLNYSQTSGLVTDDEGNTIAKGWAGCGIGKNQPGMQAVPSVGPLPRGIYSVSDWHNHPRLGQMVARLIQTEGEAFGRNDFFIHGPSKDPKRFGQESQGCIVIPRPGREKVFELTRLTGSTITVTV